MLKTYIANIYKFILKNKIIFFILITLIPIAIITTVLLKSQPTPPHPKLIETIIPPSSISKDSSIILTKNTSLFSLQSSNSYFYKTKSTGIAAAREFMTQNPTYNSQPLIPKNFKENAPLLKTVKDSVNPSSVFYTFGQNINKIPVFNAGLKIHLKNGNEIYSVQANLINNFQIEEQKLSEQTAQNIATLQAQKDAPQNTPLILESTQKYILNKKILGENDETNYLTLAVIIKNAENSPSWFNKQYFIDLNNGTIVYQINLTPS
jgi:Zn-dependent metalloprotease